MILHNYDYELSDNLSINKKYVLWNEVSVPLAIYMKLQIYRGHDHFIDLLGSRDVICHVTIVFAILGLL